MFARHLYSVKKKSHHIYFYTDALDDPRKNRYSLSITVSQAMNEGMTKVRLGINAVTSEAYLKWYGPVGYENPSWWDMTCGPKEHYPYLLQYLISITSLESTMPLKGKIKFINRHTYLATGHRKLEINIEIPDLYTIELSWPECIVKKHDYQVTQNQLQASVGK